MEDGVAVAIARTWHRPGCRKPRLYGLRCMIEKRLRVAGVEVLTVTCPDCHRTQSFELKAIEG